jgi:hypothetical protein
MLYIRLQSMSFSLRGSICKTCRVDGILISLLDCMSNKMHLGPIVVSSCQHGYPHSSYSLSRSVRNQSSSSTSECRYTLELKFEIGYE